MQYYNKTTGKRVATNDELLRLKAEGNLIEIDEEKDGDEIDEQFLSECCGSPINDQGMCTDCKEFCN